MADDDDCFPDDWGPAPEEEAAEAEDAVIETDEVEAEAEPEAEDEAEMADEAEPAMQIDVGGEDETAWEGAEVVQEVDGEEDDDDDDDLAAEEAAALAALGAGAALEEEAADGEADVQVEAEEEEEWQPPARPPLSAHPKGKGKAPIVKTGAPRPPGIRPAISKLPVVRPPWARGPTPVGGKTFFGKGPIVPGGKGAGPGMLAKGKGGFKAPWGGKPGGSQPVPSRPWAASIAPGKGFNTSAIGKNPSSKGFGKSVAHHTLL